MMKSLQRVPDPKHRYLNLYFEVHQPRRLRPFRFFDIGQGVSYFDDKLNAEIVRRVAASCYLPTGTMLLDLVRRYPGLRITFSISGTALEQLSLYAPDVIGLLRLMADTGAIEFLAETHYHSLASLSSTEEFKRQVLRHRQEMNKHLGVTPRVFRNTELIFSNETAARIAELGFDGMLLEGTRELHLQHRSDQLLKHSGSDLVLFPRNFLLSDDVAFRFSDPGSRHRTLSPDEFLSRIMTVTGPGGITSLGMDFETFGEHNKASDGIVSFLENFLSAAAKTRGLRFINPSQAIERFRPSRIWSGTSTTSWADNAKDLSAWLGNAMQREAFHFLNALLLPARLAGNKEILADHRYLQTSDHLYYMSTKLNADGDVHRYFSPYDSPYEAFMNYMNALSDLEWRIGQSVKAKPSMRVQRPPVSRRSLKTAVN
jgi:alpha-amylase